ncbi:MAG: hypothetical protein FJ164_09625 [Gammaproteobacteria bacterium]|nr:hypothetical protein [Gammaproteobacteria bacterium]
MKPVRLLLMTCLLPTTGLTEPAGAPGFATCAAYYFLAARGNDVTQYDALYSAGEFSLNEAIKRHGKAAQGRMESTSADMMQSIAKDWRRVAELDPEFSRPCETLLRDAGFRAP